jgi:hypothetical protein
MSQNIKNPKYNLELERILDNYLKLKEWKYYFDEFKIQMKNYTIIIYFPFS